VREMCPDLLFPSASVFPLRLCACVRQFYGINEGTPLFFGNKDEGKFGTYWVKDGKARAQPAPRPARGGRAASQRSSAAAGASVHIVTSATSHAVLWTRPHTAVQCDTPNP